MRPKAGWTLIELMIVIAILAVLNEAVFLPIAKILVDLRRFQQETVDQELVFKGYVLLRAMMGRSRSVRVIDGDRLVADGVIPMELTRREDGRTLVLSRAGGKTVLSFQRAMRWGPFAEVDSRTFVSTVELMGKTFPMYWRAAAP